MAAVLIALSVAIKPLGLVLLLLAPVVYTPLRWRLILAVVGLVIFPFLFGSPHYVVAQLHSALVNLQGCAIVTQHRFADINGIFRTLGAPLPASASRFIRVLAGGLTLAFWWASAIRLAEPSRAMWLHALTASYLMLFNPMTEANSYVILAPALGAWGMFFLVGSGARFARSLGWAIAGTALTMAFLPNLLRPLFGNRFALFWHPLMTLVFIVMLGGFLWRKARQSQPGNLDPDHNQT
jgi:hypothetical protein